MYYGIFDWGLLFFISDHLKKCLHPSSLPCHLKGHNCILNNLFTYNLAYYIHTPSKPHQTHLYIFQGMPSQWCYLAYMMSCLSDIDSDKWCRPNHRHVFHGMLGRSSDIYILHDYFSQHIFVPGLYISCCCIILHLKYKHITCKCKRLSEITCKVLLNL